MHCIQPTLVFFNMSYPHDESMCPFSEATLAPAALDALILGIRGVWAVFLGPEPRKEICADSSLETIVRGTVSEMLTCPMGTTQPLPTGRQRQLCLLVHPQLAQALRSAWPNVDELACFGRAMEMATMLARRVLQSQ